VRVLEDDQDRLPGGEAEELADQRLEGARPLLRRCQPELAVARPAIEPEQCGEYGRCGCHVVDGPAEQRLELVETVLDRLVGTMPAARVSCWIAGWSGEPVW
jgi:hypothetical protein